jgi:hypothetical protein
MADEEHGLGEGVKHFHHGIDVIAEPNSGELDISRSLARQGEGVYPMTSTFERRDHGAK